MQEDAQPKGSRRSHVAAYHGQSKNALKNMSCDVK